MTELKMDDAWWGQRLTPSVIVAAGDRTLRPEWRRNAAGQWLGIEPRQGQRRHLPHVPQPELLGVKEAL